MIRANLLPPRAQGALVFGYRLELSDLWRLTAAAGGILAGIIVTLLIFGTQTSRLQSRLDELNTQLASLAPQTNDVGQLTSDVHRLQEIDRDAIWLRRSGHVVALRLVYLGNAVPQGAWVEHMGQDRTGWTIEGGGRTLYAMSRVLSNFARISPGMQTSFNNVTGQGQSSQATYSFKASIAPPRATPPPAAAGQK